MERTIWLTGERIAASATGAPSERRARVSGVSLGGRQAIKKAAPSLVPPAYGPGLVCGTTAVSFHTNDHAAMGLTAWDGTPLGSRGAGYG